MDESTLDTMLIPHYLGERAMAVPTQNGDLKRSLDLVVEGRIAEVSYQLKKAQLDWLNQGGIINEVSAMNVEEIAALSQAETLRYSKVLNCSSELSLQSLRKALHNDRGIGFAMDVHPLTDNPRDMLTVHRRIFFLNVTLPCYGEAFLNAAEQRLRAASSITITDEIKSILVNYLHANGASLCGIVFNNGMCLTAVDATYPKLLQTYENRMKVNKRRLAAGKLGYSFGFAQYCGVVCEKISLAHNKAGEFGVGSFIKSPFRGGHSPYFGKSDFRLVYGFSKAISSGEVMLNDRLGYIIAKALNQYSQQLIDQLMHHDDSITTSCNIVAMRTSSTEEVHA